MKWVIWNDPMQNNEQNIDQLFRDKLKNFEATPPPEVWERISASMGYQRKRRKVLLIWTMSGAASLLFAFLLGWYLAGNSNGGEQLMVELQQYKQQRNQQLLWQPKVEQHLVFNFERPVFQKIKTGVTTENHFTATLVAQQQLQSLAHLSSLASGGLAQKNSFPELAVTGEEAFFSTSDRAILAANLESRAKETSVQHNDSWAVGLSASPLYRFDPSLNNQADYEMAMNQMPSSYQTRISGGINVAYATGKKLDVITGINYAEVAQDAGQVALSFLGHNWLNERSDAGFAAESYNNDLLPSNNANNLVLSTQVGLANINLPVGATVATAKTMTALVPDATQNYNYKQSARYVEIPMLLRYHLIESRLGVHVTGGFNSNILVDNSVRLVDDKTVVANGKIEGLRPLTWSSSLGLGVNYSLTDALDLNVEPMLKFQLNSLNSQSYFNARPAAFGVYSGISYRF